MVSNKKHQGVPEVLIIVLLMLFILRCSVQFQGDVWRLAFCDVQECVKNRVVFKEIVKALAKQFAP